MDQPERLRRVAEAAAFLGVPVATLYQWRNRGVPVRPAQQRLHPVRGPLAGLLGQRKINHQGEDHPKRRSTAVAVLDE